MDNCSKKKGLASDEILEDLWGSLCVRWESRDRLKSRLKLATLQYGLFSFRKANRRL